MTALLIQFRVWFSACDCKCIMGRSFKIMLLGIISRVCILAAVLSAVDCKSPVDDMSRESEHEDVRGFTTCSRWWLLRSQEPMTCRSLRVLFLYPIAIGYAINAKHGVFDEHCYVSMRERRMSSFRDTCLIRTALLTPCAHALMTIYARNVHAPALIVQYVLAEDRSVVTRNGAIGYNVFI